ncbi:unnamed protein product [Mytilus coruscus]|uniref:Uncharacterized protein n=1 Tax=Mytilus coruscus TaxID=42192 RepID=A0A6J7ZY26_MYTCO|nr:unnamed protein product [Mytilus coruscus]
MSNKVELQEELTSLLHGIVRPPALMLSHPKKSSSELNIGQYEVLGCEPLHDITNLVQNVITELPNHIKDPAVQKQFQHFTATTIGNKNQLKGSDARMFAVKLTKFATTLYMNQQLDTNIMELINSLIDIVHICYSPYESRTPKSILRLHNQCFKFGIIGRIVFGIPTKMTTRKFFGSHFHSLTTHASETYRIFNLKSIVTEQEERCFWDLRRVSESTTNRQAGHIVDNAIMRITTQQQLVYKQNSFTIQDSCISKQARLLPPRPRTIFSSELIANRSVLVTSHLKRIAHFIICGKDVWWVMENGNMVFFDGPDDPQFHREGPTLHHFRSSSLKKEQTFLLNTWQLILEMFENGSLELPLNKIKVVDDDGKSRYISFASNSNNNRAEQDDVLEEISIREKIATSERCEEIATTERCEETTTTERCDKETLENGTATNLNDLTNRRKPIEKMAPPSIFVKYNYKHGLDIQQPKEDENKQVRCMYKSYIKDKKIDVDVLSTTTARKKMGIKRKLFEDTGKQDFINLKKLPTTNKMKMVENFIVNSNKAVADVPKHRTDMDFCIELLGETDETRNVIKYQMSLEKHPGNKSFSSSLETNMAKLQTSVSKEHNRLKNMLLDAHTDIDASINRKSE